MPSLGASVTSWHDEHRCPQRSAGVSQTTRSTDEQPHAFVPSRVRPACEAAAARLRHSRGPKKTQHGHPGVTPAPLPSAERGCVADQPQHGHTTHVFVPSRARPACEAAAARLRHSRGPKQTLHGHPVSPRAPWSSRSAGVSQTTRSTDEQSHGHASGVEGTPSDLHSRCGRFRSAHPPREPASSIYGNPRHLRISFARSGAGSIIYPAPRGSHPWLTTIVPLGLVPPGRLRSPHQRRFSPGPFGSPHHRRPSRCAYPIGLHRGQCGR